MVELSIKQAEVLLWKKKCMSAACVNIMKKFGDQVDEGEIYEDGCFCKLNRNDLHFENCLEVNPKGCPHFKRK